MKKPYILYVFITLLCCPYFGYANVIITGTRVIYHSNEKSVTIKMTNEGRTPSLVQAWVEDSEIENKQTNKKTPFLLTPPIVRIEPNTGQELRLFFTGEQELSNKVEHLFWLNILDIPPKNKSSTGNQLSLAINNKLKLFYRPSNLPAPAETDFKKLLFSLENRQLIVTNPTPYYISLIGVGNICDKTFGGLPLKPLSKSVICKTNKNKLNFNFSYSVIDDFGAIKLINK